MYRAAQTPVDRLLDDARLRRAHAGDRVLYDAAAVVAALVDTDAPTELWARLKRGIPALARRARTAAFPAGRARGGSEQADALDLRGVLRLIQAIDSPRADALKRWL